MSKGNNSPPFDKELEIEKINHKENYRGPLKQSSVDSLNKYTTKKTSKRLSNRDGAILHENSG